MRVELSSHYTILRDAAERNNAKLMSIQNAFIFFNFLTENDASFFITEVQQYVEDELDINTHRFGVVAEVIVPHKKWKYP